MTDGKGGDMINREIINFPEINGGMLANVVTAKIISAFKILTILILNQIINWKIIIPQKQF